MCSLVVIPCTPVQGHASGIIFITSVSIIFILEVHTVVFIYQMRAYQKELFFFVMTGPLLLRGMGDETFSISSQVKPLKKVLDVTLGKKKNSN